MLLLSRRRGESICIGDDVEVKVMSIRGNAVSLGIGAPDDVAIDRREVRARKLREANVLDVGTRSDEEIEEHLRNFISRTGDGVSSPEELFVWVVDNKERLARFLLTP